MKNAIVSWSGGKDSCHAAYRAMQHGYKIAYLANMVSQKYKRVGFHGVKDTVIADQAKAIGIPLWQGKTTGFTYEEELQKHLKKKTKGLDALVFGDIFLTDCLAMAKRVSSSVNLSLLEPLWGEKPEEVLKDFVKAGFEAVIVSTQGSLLEKEWVGRVINESFIDDIHKLSAIDPCGENGEYHSLVVDGPIFKKRIEIMRSQKIFRDGYWFLDIQEYQLVSKSN